MPRGVLVAVGAVVVVVLGAIALVVALAGDDAPAAPAPTIDADSATTIPYYADYPEYLRAIEPCPPGEPVPIEQGGAAPFRLEPALQLEQPSVVVFGPDGTAFLGERTGRILAWDGEADPEVVLDLSDDTAAEGDQGLLGLAVSPDGAWLYSNRTAANGDSRLDAWPLVEGRPDAEGASLILTIDQPSALHNGGGLAFGPDGMLWATFGDGGGLGDWYHNSQDRSTPLGSVLRLDPRPGEDPPYLVPSDNPFAGSPDAEPLAWAVGVRNPFRFSFDPVTGDLWLPDLGQQCFEELNVLGADEAGADLGWNVFEGNEPFLGELPAGTVHRAPDFTYPHRSGYCAIVGGHVYRGSAIPGLAGTYVFSDFCTGELLTLGADRSTATEYGVSVLQPVDLAVDPDGELWVVALSGEVSRLRPA